MGQRLTRRENWPSLLGEFLAANVDTPFEYGKFDCCMAGIKAVAVMTGQNSKVLGDLVLEGTGADQKYTDTNLSETLDKVSGILGLVERVKKSFDFQLVSKTKAGPGDICIVDTEEGPAFGVLDNSARYVFVPKRPSGWGRLSRTAVRVALRI